MILLVVHQAAYPSIWPAAPSLQQGRPTNPVVRMWVQLKRWCTGKYIFRAANAWWSVRSILLLPPVAKCLETIDVCISCMFVFMSVVFSVFIVRHVGAGVCDV